MEIVGHRGAAALVPENTIPSFEKALELGCDSTETDVRLTRDGYLILCHDDSVDRTTNGTGKIAELTFEEIRALDAGNGAQVPLLTELLPLIRDRILLLCELKEANTWGPAVAAVREAGLVEQVIFTSFNIDWLAATRALGEDLRLAANFMRPDYDILPRLKELRCEAADVHWKNLTPEFLQTVHAQGFDCRGWNPDTPEDIRATLALGVKSISSNRPDLVIEIVRGGG